MSLDQLLNALHAVGAGFVTAVAVVRAAQLRRSDPSGRLLWCALAALAVGQALQVVQVYRAVEDVVAVPGAAAVVKHGAALVAAGCTAAVVQRLVAAEGRSVRSRLIWGGLAAALTVSVLPWFLDPPRRVPPLLADRAEFYASSWLSVLHWAAFLTYLGCALWVASAVCWRFRRETGTNPASSATRTAVSLVGIGTSVGGVGYIGEKTLTVLLWDAGRATPTVVSFDRIAEAFTLAASVTLIAVGVQWEAAARWRDHRRALRAIKPLRRQLRDQFGDRDAMMPSTHRTEQRLVAALSDVHDRLRRLTTYVSPRDVDEVTWLRRALAVTPDQPAGLRPTASPIQDAGSAIHAAHRLAALHAAATRDSGHPSDTEADVPAGRPR